MLVDHGTVLPRISWTGILAGLVVGVVTQLALTALGVAAGAASIDSARGLAIGTVTWLAVSLAISAFLAGLVAARAAGYLTPAQGRFNGLLTGMLLALGLTLFSYNALLGGARTALGLAGSAANAVGMGSAASSQTAQDAAQSGPVQQLLSGLDEEELGQIIAENSPTLDQEQTTAAARVVSGIVRRASNDIGSNLTNVSNLDDLVTNRVTSVRSALSGEQFVTRLQRQGLSQAEAQETQRAVTQQVDELQRQATQTAAATERIARRAAGTAGWTFLLALGLLLGFSALGGGRGSDVPKGGALVKGRDEELRGRNV
ncbi:YrzE family protein [Deinococcus pimensis]|uniref:YrzE family protein n=1 Tax=Deinococcus pimensis TaxID=309888 RepID=UPI0004AF8F48|nr:YrzE family protein [Deinococcus pimensis]